MSRARTLHPVKGRVSGLVLGLGLSLGLVSFPVAAQPSPTPDPVQTSGVQTAANQVVLETSAGEILIALEPDAPLTAANFLRYVDEGRLDGTDFYRSMVIAAGTGLVQGGTNNRPERILAPIPHEATSASGLTHNDGAVSMARHEPGTATGDFFIIVGDVSSLDANRLAAGDPGFAVFGRVIKGMEIVRQILTLPTSPTQGEGFLRGQMLDPPVRIISARQAVSGTSQQAD